MTQDIIIRSEAGKPMAEADNEAIRQMQALAEKAAKSADGERQRIHLILRNQQLADILKRTPLSETLAEQVELYAYTEQDLWSMAMLGVQPVARRVWTASPSRPIARNASIWSSSA